ncbi:MAG: HAD family hydrolase [Clostridia bacterium]|nr:HAD family hydrolase [Clostridia bacterium]
MNYKNIFLDLDGTLTDSGEGIMNSVAYSLRKFGIEETNREKLRTFIGPPLFASYIREYGFDHEKALLAVDYYREYFAPKGIYENRPYDGIPELLRDLKAAGRKLYLATSKPEPYALEIVKHFGLWQYLDGLFGSTMTEERTKKEEVVAYALENTGIDKDNVVMIGDRSHDIIGAKANGVRSIGVLFGYGSREELEDAGADAIAETVEDLRQILFMEE